MSDARDVVEPKAKQIWPAAAPARMETLSQLAKGAMPHAGPKRWSAPADPGESFFLSEFLRLTPTS